MATRPPTLTEILLDASPPPWTLSAFMAYLSQNHCMETLEFTLDSQRYAAFYDQLAAENPPSLESNARVCGLWDKLMEVYIVPCAPREVNIPARVRDRLLSLPSGPAAPHSAELAEAGRIIYELMNDSLLVPFLQSVAPLHFTGQNDDSGHHSHRSQNAVRQSDQTQRSVASPHSADFDSLTDDSDSNSPSAPEPITPPTTPPTSEYTFNSSPGGFQRAMAAHNKGWKKVGEKLGFSRKASSRRSTPTSSSSDYDAALRESSHSHA
ncbi:regulator of G-protein signaling [Metarhizium album ARSEF 1941]|uniref:Regulator of G-protein signaling n=1 Tax=Metarhizium album (strain ARSEF 1941) TaxID=1081103 RepID=A0A0B2WUT3_METAS|nr:regulator of G-protein signaling [Metarhizium album ARSEF 1941]KHN97833.1 regulator of G-protein signaling [Metarhizium album ARSEF 1941]